MVKDVDESSQFCITRFVWRKSRAFFKDFSVEGPTTKGLQYDIYRKEKSRTRGGGGGCWPSFTNIHTLTCTNLVISVCDFLFLAYGYPKRTNWWFSVFNLSPMTKYMTSCWWTKQNSPMKICCGRSRAQQIT